MIQGGVGVDNGINQIQKSLYYENCAKICHEFNPLK